MIVLRCSRCDREIEIYEPLANQSILCPNCGQVLARGSGVESKNKKNGGADSTLVAERGPGADTDSEELSFLKPRQNDDELGRLSHYRVLKLLGKGGMAMVFMAEDTILQRP